jgi:hypothetical protein
MKKLFMILAITLLATSVSAQVSVPVSAYLGGAMSVPASTDFNSAWKWGYHGWAGVGYKMAAGLQVTGKVEYHNFFFDMMDYVGVEGGNTKVWMYGVDGRYKLNLPAFPIKPFVLAGAGIARVSWDDFEGTSLIASTLNATVPDPQSKMYYNFGGGLELMALPTFGLFAEARYVSIGTDGERMNFVPMSLGLRFF